MRALAALLAVATLEAASVDSQIVSLQSVNLQSLNLQSLNLQSLNQSSIRNPQSSIRSPQSSIQIVRIDVIAADARGRKLDNLKPADFELEDDGVAQALDSVRFVRPTPEEGRLVAVFLDEYHVGAAATDRVRDEMTRFVERDLSPEDELVVMKPLDSLFTIQLTRDREMAQSAIARFEGRAGDYAPRNPYEKDFMAGVPARIESARTQVTLSALNALAVHFSRYDDRRKTLIVVSEGLGRGERRRGLEYLPTTDTIVRSAQQANVAIYPVNPSANPGEAGTLAALAAPTAGRPIAADLDDGLRHALDDASGYYLLTYRASRLEDGRFHAVEVQVKRPGAQVRARNGYFSPSPDESLRRALLAQLNEPKRAVPLDPAPHASTLIRPWFGTSRGSDGRTRVTFVWEPAGHITGDRVRHVPTRVTLTALATDDSVLFEGPVNPTGPALIDEPAGVSARAVFETPPGRLRVRMSILDSAQQAIDSDIRSISVRDMRSGLLIGTPEVLRARNAREFRALDTGLAVPVSSREFSRSERLRIRFYVYGPDDSPVSVSARLLSRMGPMRDLPTTVSSAGMHEIDLSLAGLATGEYFVELSAKGQNGETKDAIDFRVTT
jgi:VWFA-related protein